MAPSSRLAPGIPLVNRVPEHHSTVTHGPFSKPIPLLLSASHSEPQLSCAPDTCTHPISRFLPFRHSSRIPHCNPVSSFATASPLNSSGFVVSPEDPVLTPAWVPLPTALQICVVYFLCYTHRNETEAEAFDTG